MVWLKVGSLFDGSNNIALDCILTALNNLSFPNLAGLAIIERAYYKDEGRTQLVYKPYDANGCEDMAFEEDDVRDKSTFHNPYYVITRVIMSAKGKLPQPQTKILNNQLGYFCFS